MPVHRVSRQARHFQAEYDSGPAQTDLGHQPLKSFAIRSRSARLPQIRIDHDDAVQRPAERGGVLSQRVLPLGALRVLEHLPQGGLPHVEISISLQMAGLHLLMRIMSHRVASPRFCRNRPAKIETISDRISGGTYPGLVVNGARSALASTAVHEQQTSIHSRIP